MLAKGEGKERKLLAISNRDPDESEADESEVTPSRRRRGSQVSSQSGRLHSEIFFPYDGDASATSSEHGSKRIIMRGCYVLHSSCKGFGGCA